MKYDVILFPPVRGTVLQIVSGLPMWANAMPWKNSAETPNIGTRAQTDDMRPGLGWQGVANLESFVKKGGVLVGVDNTVEFAVQLGLVNGVSINTPPKGEGARQPAALEDRGRRAGGAGARRAFRHKSRVARRSGAISSCSTPS